MRVIVNRNQVEHAPSHECENGLPTPAYESPRRVEAVRAALSSRGGYAFEEAPLVDERAVLELHEPAYVEFLRRTSADLARAPAGAPRFAIPSVFPYGPNGPRHRGKAQSGIFCFDTYTPIMPGTFDAALSSASAASHGADLLARGEERSLYVLARPPGHHAERGRCGGYSYFNNAALAALRLAQLGTVAVLDLDVHHGNGTQHAFYDRPDVLVVSLHGDPDYLFPHFSGFEDETGTGRGLGFNRNFPLPAATGERTYRPALETALEVTGRFRPAFLIVSFGTDTHEADPIGGFKLKTPFFARMGALVRQLDMPMLIIQEGGYNLETIGECAAEFLEALRPS